MASFFVRNRLFETEMEATLKYKAYLRARAEMAATRVRAIADQVGEPWMPRGGRAITVEEDGDQVLIVNTDYGAWIAEVGSVNNPAHAPLRNGVRAAGLRLREE